MSRKPNYANRAISLLQELKRKYPSCSVASHFLTATIDYKYHISDKELCFALDKYMTELDLEHTPITSGDELQHIIDEGKKLDRILLTEDDDEEDNF